MTELRALRSVAASVEKMVAGLHRDDLATKARRIRGSVTTLQPPTREVVKLLDALAKAKAARAKP